MNLADGLHRAARTRPFAVAVIDQGRITHFQSLDLAVWRAAAWFRRQGVAPGDVVGITLGASFSHLVVALALARMGAVQVTLAPSEPLAARVSLVHRTGVRVVVGDGPKAREPGLPVLEPQPAWLRADGEGIEPSVRAAGGAMPWAIVASSGTTGEPKLFKVTHDAENSWAEQFASCFDLEPGGRFLCFVGMGFIVGKRLNLMALERGWTVVFHPKLAPVDADTALALIEQLGVQALMGTPLQIEQLLERCPQDVVRLPQLRSLVITTAVVGERLRAAIRRRLSPKLTVAYGANEIGVVTAADAATQLLHAGTIGRPVPGIEARVVGEDGMALPPGEVGRLGFRRAGFELAYLGDPEATGRTVRDGWYQPGDLGAIMADGAIVFHGRADDLMNCDGIKIYPTEVEHVLLQHPAVLEAAAFPIPSERYQQVPVAAVVAAAPVSEAALLAFCQERMGVRHPRRVMVVEALPRNPLGKVLKRELAVALVARLRPGDAP